MFTKYIKTIQVLTALMSQGNLGYRLSFEVIHYTDNGGFRIDVYQTSQYIGNDNMHRIVINCHKVSGLEVWSDKINSWTNDGNYNDVKIKMDDLLEHLFKILSFYESELGKKE